MTHYSPQDIVDLLRAALTGAFASNFPKGTRLVNCNSTQEFFGPKSPSPVRFWIPDPHKHRAQMRASGEEDVQTESEEIPTKGGDLRQVLFQLEDDSRPLLQIQCDGIVVDDLLGSLGLVQFCYGKSQRELILQYVREAMGLCHEIQRRSRGGRAYYVELVLVIPTLDTSAIASVGNVLRQVMSETGYLHAIGVHVLTYSQTQDLIGFRDSLPRAFSWLLPCCRNWFNEVCDERRRRAEEIYSEQGTWERLPGLSQLTLKDIRLQGERKWQPNYGTPKSKPPQERIALHVIHGQNGTGKTTFIDAIELALTNQVERIQRTTNTSGGLQVLRNRALPSEKKASITLQLHSNTRTNVRKEHVDVTLDPEGNAKFEMLGNKSNRKSSLFLEAYREDPHCKAAGAFRLEQNMADRLTVGDSGDRARTILSSFFAKSDQQRRNVEGYKSRWRNAVQQLREAWPEAAESVPWLKDVLFSDNDTNATAQFWTVVQKLSTEGANWDNIGVLYTEDPAAFRQELERLLGNDLIATLLSNLEVSRNSDRALMPLSVEIDRYLSSPSHSKQNVERVEHLLRDVFSWKADNAGKSGTFLDYHDAVCNWLTKHVEFDLVARVEQVSETVSQAEKGSELALQLEGIKKITGQAKSKRAWVDSDTYLVRRETAWKELINFQTTEEVSRPATSKPQLTEAEYLQIDQLIRMTPPLGQLIREALRDDSRQDGIFQGGSFILGSGASSSGKPIFDYLDNLRTALANVEKLRVRRIPDLTRVYTALRNFEPLRQEKQALDNQAVKDLQTHFQPNGKLTLALNELLAMFTPARWAYEGIGVSAKLQDDAPEVAFQTSSQEVSQVLNTAELNILALSLFFLCAPNTPNPLNLLVLDDPLQNMDELTVTTVARGIDRLIRLWKTEPFNDSSLAPLSDMTLLLLLHGEDDTDRFRSETSCATYSLPWLLPVDAMSDSQQLIEGQLANEGLFKIQLSAEQLVEND